VAPVVSTVIFRMALGNTLTSPAEMGLGAVFPVLFIPLVMIAWQYDFHWVLFFTIGMALADLAVLSLDLGKISPNTIPLISSVIIRAFSLGIVGNIVTQLVETQAEQRRDLIHANIQLSRHAATLEDLGVSQERNRLARELHDTLAHTLSGTAVNLEAMRLLIPPEMGEVHRMLDQSLENTRGGLAETRRALKDLRSQPLEDLGLVIAIRDLAADCAERSGLKLDLDLPSMPLELTPDVEQCMYRIAQEALANVLRHAEASRVGVRLRSDLDCVSLEIHDDGRGFDVDSIDATEQFGLRGMRERARLVGGALNVESLPGQGTRIQFDYRVSND
jgi:signal transduction histidine kinase